MEKQWELTQKFNREVMLEEVNKAARELITDQNQVVIMYAPDKEDVHLPTEQQIEDVILATQRQHYAPYEEEHVDGQLLIEQPKAGTILTEKPWKHGFTELTLSNGMKVYVRQTDFSKNTIQMTMKADGGTSVYGDEDIPNFSLISSAVTEGGVGVWDAATLRKKLADKSVRVQVSVGSQSQSITGGASVKDVETMMQVAYLYFTQPRRDTAAFAGLYNRSYSFLNNRNASPRVDYNDSITAILYGHHPRMEPMSQERLTKVNYDRILEIYKDRFGNAADFQTVIIGNMSLDELRPMICQYLASLPSVGQKHSVVNKANVPQLQKGDFARIFKKKMATPLANVSIYHMADVPFTSKNDLTLDFLKRILSIAYTDSVREEKGGTYGVSVDFNLVKDEAPNAILKISYNADPSRYKELNPVVYQQLQSIADRGPQPASLEKVRQYLLKQYDQMAITNGYWDYVVWHQLDDNEDFDQGYCDMARQMTAADIQQMARILLQQNNRIEITMLSE
jgi:zinc protease